ncbi:amidase [Bordetella petrii]|nr:amidase [Bordetella petrii]
MKPLIQLTALQAAAALENRDITAGALAQAYLDRIEERNGEVRAYVAHDPARVRGEAEQAQAGGGLLRGLPYAVKDIIATRDYPTAFGSPIYQGYAPGRDAGVVACAAEQGAVLLGKVGTGEFATQTPGQARNPRNLAHTPGGSSSGSAAAVADGMAVAALGTQTTGSIVRPAVYCGVVGYKPSFGMLSSAGVGVLSPLQDTVGLITRDVADAAFFAAGLHGHRLLPRALDRPRVGLCLSRQWEHAKPETVQAIERLAERLARAGAQVRRIQLPADLEDLVEGQGRMVAYDARQALAYERTRHYGQLSPRLQARLQYGEQMTLPEYLAFAQRAMQARVQAGALFDGLDVLLYPAAEGEAEHGLDNSGSPRFGALWTLLHMPAVSFPIASGPGGLPLGAQVIGAYGDDFRALAAAQFVAAHAEPF